MFACCPIARIYSRLGDVVAYASIGIMGLSALLVRWGSRQGLEVGDRSS